MGVRNQRSEGPWHRRRLGGCLWLLSALALGCTAPRHSGDDFVYQRLPPVGELESSVRVDADPDVVWQRLVARLTESSLFITEIDRDSRLITAEFSAPNPGDYLDCGTAEAEYVERNDTAQTRLRLAEGGRIEWGTYRRTFAGAEVESRASVDLTARLDGGVNVYVAPVQGGTEVVVNARYMLGITHAGARRAGGPQDDLGLNAVYAFTTHGREEYRTPSAVVAVLRCTPTGDLEHRVLDMAR